MPTLITWPSTVHTTDVTDQIRDAIGRDVTFHVVASSYECPVCGLDPINNTALDSFCPTCSGIGYIIEYGETDLPAHITWGHSEKLGWETGGQLDEGDCRVQIKYTVANAGIVDATKWVTVDNRRMQIIKSLLRGVPVINRILIDLIEIEKE